MHQLAHADLFCQFIDGNVSFALYEIHYGQEGGSVHVAALACCIDALVAKAQRDAKARDDLQQAVVIVDEITHVSGCREMHRWKR